MRMSRIVHIVGAKHLRLNNIFSIRNYAIMHSDAIEVLIDIRMT